MSTIEATTLEMQKLTPAQQEQVLAYARSLKQGKLPPGTKVKDLMKFVGSISSEDLKLMEQAIEEGCEQVNPNGW
jgi:hypothetical protein